MDQNRKCPICGGEFEEGMLSDFTYGGATRVRWVTKLKTFLGMSNGVENPKQLTAHRCKNCGYLESYAK